MDKKSSKNQESNDLKGFQDYIDDLASKPSGQKLGNLSKKAEGQFEHYTFLINDGNRLKKIKQLYGEKINFSANFDQGIKIIQLQKEEIEDLKNKIFDKMNSSNSGYLKSVSEIYDSFFSSTEHEID
jgi:hypothetical protein